METCEEWARNNFGAATLGNKSRTKRVVSIACNAARRAGASLPGQCAGKNAPLTATYRFMSEEHNTPEKILSGHIAQTARACQRYEVVLCVQDTTELDYTGREVEGLGEIGNGNGRGLMQHSVLALTPAGSLIGLLDVNIHKRVKAPENETTQQRQSRRTQRAVWTECAERIERVDTGTTKLLYVCDREADCAGFLFGMKKHKRHFIVRAKHDRKADGDVRLWEHMSRQPVSCEYELEVPARKLGRKPKGWRKAKVSVRYAPVKIAPPVRDPRHAKSEPLELWAVQAVELEAPEGYEAVEWMLLTSEKVESAQEALKTIDYYKQRWKIEEWHRCLKQGCGVEKAQLKTAHALANLAALYSTVAVRLVQLRDASRDTSMANEPALTVVPEIMVKAVALLNDADERTLSVKKFYDAVARQGGWLGRNQAGWLTLWRGWQQINMIAEGLRLALKNHAKHVER